jgi:hypothetical protein
MILKRVMQVALTRTTEPTSGDLTAYAGTEYWRVEWTEVRNGKVKELGQAHHTEAAARRHVEGLLGQRISGLSMDAIYSERL